jgi:hypothetical protein
MAENEHAGGCHCGAVRFAVRADLDQTLQCNCSICTKGGFIWAFVPAEQFRLTQEGDTTEYLFNRHAIHHRFCRVCGMETHAHGQHPATGAMMVAVNARCIDEIDLSALKPKSVDGRSL